MYDTCELYRCVSSSSVKYSLISTFSRISFVNFGRLCVRAYRRASDLPVLAS